MTAAKLEPILKRMSRFHVGDKLAETGLSVTALQVESRMLFVANEAWTNVENTNLLLCASSWVTAWPQPQDFQPVLSQMRSAFDHLLERVSDKTDISMSCKVECSQW